MNVPNYTGTTYSAGTGLTLTTNTFAVNTSQNISTLSNLTSNGLVKTSGGTGALSIATAGTDYLTPTGNGSGLTSLNASNISSGTLPVAQVPNLDASKITTGSFASAQITDGTIVDADVNAAAAIAGTKINPNFGAQNISTTGTLTTGTGGAFAVNATGNITKINNVTTLFPSAQGAASTVLTNNGSGTLTWAAPPTGWSLTGNAGTIDGTNFIGTTDNIPLSFRVNGQKAGRIDHLIGNTFLGYQAGNSNTTGYYNTANGYQALFSNTTAYQNTANGYQALFSNTTGYANTANGWASLYSNTTGYGNTANGFRTLYSNTTGYANTASGGYALDSNTTGYANTASGVNALYSNTTGNSNTANGVNALYSNTTGDSNIANGVSALASNTTGDSNIANGVSALASNTTGSFNTALGIAALQSNTTGSSNTAIGLAADVSTGGLTNATAIGANAKVATSNSMVLGGTGADAVKVGIGTTTPAVTLDIKATDAVNMPDGTTAQRPATPAAGAMRYNNTENVMEYYNGTNWYFINPKEAVLKDLKPNGTSGGDYFSSLTWQRRDLNTIEGDNSFVSILSNTFTLLPGEYTIEASAPAYNINLHKIRLRNTSAGTTTALGTNEYAWSGGQGYSSSKLYARFTIATANTFEVQHHGESSAIGGMGSQSNAGGVQEVYTQVKITKLR